MSYIMINDESFDSTAIKIIKRTHTNNTYGIDYYCNVGDIGTLVHVDFCDLLAKDNSASKLAYDFIVCLIINKQDGMININSIMNAANKLYRNTLEKYVEHVDISDIKKLKQDVMNDYEKYLLRLAHNLFV